MKRIISMLLLTIICVCTFVMSIDVVGKTTNSPTRIINVVYDDSGSMINTGNKMVDTWCQAKYAMEVFSSMLGKDDTMNVYVMSDFSKATSASTKLILKGNDGASVNVSKIHNMITTASDTPFNSVRKAYSDLMSVSATEKWLVVLTDGEFQGIDNVDSFFARKDKSIKVMFLSMGPNAAEITENEKQKIFFEKAQSSHQILEKITGICTRIFNSDRLKVDPSSKVFDFDVPMGELVVFAQGANVSINGVKSSTGEIIKSTSTPVDVRYSKKAASNYDNVLVDTDLVGKIATFNGDFEPGKYTVDVTGAETVEIYYKPNVEIAAYLTNKDGEEVTELNNLETGEYTISFGFVKGKTKEKVNQSKLLGKVTYEAVVTNNGRKHKKSYSSGDAIFIEEGSLKIDATARYLDYNSVSTSLEYLVFKNKKIAFSVVDNPNYIVTREGFATDFPVRIKATIDGNDFTEEQWKAMGLPTISTKESTDYTLGDFAVEKSDETGVFIVRPTLRDGKPSTGTYVDGTYVISYTGKYEIETWSGNTEIQLRFQDERSWLERNWDLVVKLIVLLAILFILVGYIPGIKHYLPKSLKKRPTISCNPNTPGQIPNDKKGKYEKDLCSTILPYFSQTGSIRIVPFGVSGVSGLKVKGARGNSMTITNIRAYAGKSNITFDNDPIEKDYSKRNYNTSAGITICVDKGEWSYTCQPNQ